MYLQMKDHNYEKKANDANLKIKWKFSVKESFYLAV